MKRVAVLRKGGRCVDYHPTGDTIAVGLNDGMKSMTYRNWKVTPFVFREERFSGSEKEDVASNVWQLFLFIVLSRRFLNFERTRHNMFICGALLGS